MMAHFTTPQSETLLPPISNKPNPAHPLTPYPPLSTLLKLNIFWAQEDLPNPAQNSGIPSPDQQQAKPGSPPGNKKTFAEHSTSSTKQEYQTCLPKKTWQR